MFGAIALAVIVVAGIIVATAIALEERKNQKNLQDKGLTTSNENGKEGVV